MTALPPLADRMRPTQLDQVLGQDRWLGADGVLRAELEAGQLGSLVFWGPPGCGKTTLARLIAGHTQALFIQLSAVLDGVKELRGVIERARVARTMEQRSTVLFVDEIHRWNKSQQDALLPHVEKGDLVLIGATTENPSFELNAALRSRVRLVRLEPLSPEQVEQLLLRALNEDEGLAALELDVEPAALRAIAQGSAGDARQALSDLERAARGLNPGDAIDGPRLERALSDRGLRHDKSGEDHYNVLSALIKSLRGSDPDASLYWLARLLAAGEAPESIARRLLIFASEDVGNADPRALEVAVAADRAVRVIGMPEGRIILAQAVTWLATCPKSNASYLAIDHALADVKRHGALPVPIHLRNAPTAHLKDEGYGAEYQYPHDHPHHIVRQQYLPDALEGQRYYEPAAHGEEKLIGQRMAWWRRKLGE